MSYRVAVHNAFEGLDDENEDPAQRTQVPRAIVEEKSEPTKKDTPKAAQVKPAAAAPKKSQDEQKRKPADQRQPLKRDGAAPVTGQDVSTGDKGARRKDFQKDKEHDRNGRPPRAQESRPPRGRQFDRKSGTGRPPTENKKGGSGSGNWGNELDDAVVATQEAKLSAEDEKDKPEKTEGEGEATSPVATKAPEPKEPELLSLDEYRAKQAQKAPKVESLKLRTAGEGVSNDAWAAYTPLEKVQEQEPTHPTHAHKKKTESKADAATAAAELLQFKHHRPAEDSDRGDRGGRGRGGFRGGRGGRGGGSRGRGEGRGGFGGYENRGSPSTRGSGNKEPTFKIDDSSFPTLGSQVKSP